MAGNHNEAPKPAVSADVSVIMALMKMGYEEEV